MIYVYIQSTNHNHLFLSSRFNKAFYDIGNKKLYPKWLCPQNITVQLPRVTSHRYVRWKKLRCGFCVCLLYDSKRKILKLNQPGLQRPSEQAQCRLIKIICYVAVVTGKQQYRKSKKHHVHYYHHHYHHTTTYNNFTMCILSNIIMMKWLNEPQHV